MPAAVAAPAGQQSLATMVAIQVAYSVSVALENCSTSGPTGVVADAVAEAVADAVKRTITIGLTTHRVETLATVVVPRGPAFRLDLAAAAAVDAVPVAAAVEVMSNQPAALRNQAAVLLLVVAVEELAAEAAVPHSTSPVAHCIRHGQEWEDSFVESAGVFFPIAKTATHLASHIPAVPVPSQIQAVDARLQRIADVDSRIRPRLDPALVRHGALERQPLHMS